MYLLQYAIERGSSEYIRLESDVIMPDSLLMVNISNYNYIWMKIHQLITSDAHSVSKIQAIKAMNKLTSSSAPLIGYGNDFILDPRFMYELYDEVKEIVVYPELIRNINILISKMDVSYIHLVDVQKNR